MPQAATDTTGNSGSTQIANSASDPVFTRIALSVNGTASAGTQFVAADLDHDGDIDLASAGKLGVHVLENLRVNNVTQSVHEETQPLNRKSVKWPTLNLHAGVGRGRHFRHTSLTVYPYWARFDDQR